MDLYLRQYDSVEECLAAYLECEVDEIDEQVGEWHWANADGIRRTKSMKEALQSIRDDKHWAWVENKERIHFWLAPDVGTRDMLALFAHEVGHMERPHRRDTYAEEQKAAKYERVIVTAWDIVQKILEERDENS